jgi:hypothetical protein
MDKTQENCSIIMKHDSGDFYKLECDTHKNTALCVYSVKGRVGMRCQIGESNKSLIDFWVPLRKLRSETEFIYVEVGTTEIVEELERLSQDGNNIEVKK